ncbi:MAG: hypothetical protein ACKV2V_05905 [Blastocatellia bacterium]
MGILDLLKRKSALPPGFEVDETNRIIKADADGLSPEDREKFFGAIFQKTGIGRHAGGLVENGYSLSFTRQHEKCPECGHATEKLYADFVYATDASSRCMSVPAGYFCPACPTVIVDEELIKKGIVGDFQYRGVVGISYNEKKPPHLLLTWNGQKTIFLLNENEDFEGIMTQDQMRAMTSATLQQRNQDSKKKDKSARRRALAKAARKRNRR